jgi:hypothetical protein
MAEFWPGRGIKGASIPHSGGIRSGFAKVPPNSNRPRRAGAMFQAWSTSPKRLSSVSNEALWDGANAFAIESDDDEWEIMQARDCVLTAPGVYELCKFLRGRLGSAHAMRAPHPVGARIVMLDQRLVRVAIQPHEWREPARFLAPPYGAAATDPRAGAIEAALPRRRSAPGPRRTFGRGAKRAMTWRSNGCAAPGSGVIPGGRASRLWPNPPSLPA